MGKDQWVIARNHTRPMYLASSNNCKLVTVIKCVSASSKAIALIVILSGLLHQKRWFTHTMLEDNILLATSESEYANNELSFEWLHHFAQQTTSIQVGAWQMLLLDGYGSHCTFEFIQYCNQHKIIPFYLLPHTTYLWCRHHRKAWTTVQTFLTTGWMTCTITLLMTLTHTWSMARDTGTGRHLKMPFTDSGAATQLMCGVTHTMTHDDSQQCTVTHGHTV